MAESDLGDIIYLLAIVAFGIIGALGRGKKKKKPMFSGSQDTQEPTFWEEIKKEMQGQFGNAETFEPEPEERVEYSDPVLGQEQPIISSALEHQDSYTYSQERLEQESIEYASEKEMSVMPGSKSRKLATTKKRLNLNLKDIDELKKGIIYSEIFNRKYI